MGLDSEAVFGVIETEDGGRIRLRKEGERRVNVASHGKEVWDMWASLPLPSAATYEDKSMV